MEKQKTCLELALERLAERAIKESTYKEYLGTLRNLGLEDVPAEKATVRYLTNVLNQVLSPGTKRKHAINLRACLGVKVPCPRPAQKVYDLPSLEQINEAFGKSLYRMYAFTMLYAGARIGEACVSQPIKGNVITFDRQRLPDGTIASPKTAGPVFVPEWFAEEYKSFEATKSHNTVYVGMRRAAKKVGLDINPHQLRHKFATELVAAGVSPNVLQKQMRHHDVAVSLRYYVQTTESDINEGVSKAFGQQPA
ncbi:MULTISPECIES: tyrosine-type recombinase/integrase [Streptomyces]|nr:MULTISPECIES: tyrosine-type recombinase/integrase [Streptomyces]WUB44559.1 tyrosine-type recombinase/integrase [Streptomyces griseorubiginosus]WUB53077.1 tyrosine-type recombinase/integrase [Streptomyces griseorubiginosus]